MPEKMCTCVCMNVCDRKFNKCLSVFEWFPPQGLLRLLLFLLGEKFGQEIFKKLPSKGKKMDKKKPGERINLSESER